MLAKRFVSSNKLSGGFRENKLEKSRIEKSRSLKETKFGYSVLGLRKPNFKTKKINFEQSHNAENCKKVPLQFLLSILLQNINKLKVDLLKSFKNFRKKPKKMRILNNAKKSARGDPLQFFTIHYAKDQKD